MADSTKEKKLANILANHLDTLDIDYAHVMTCFTQTNGAALHANLFELFLMFLNHWAGMYESGTVQPHQKLYTICQMSAKMRKALNG